MQREMCNEDSLVCKEEQAGSSAGHAECLRSAGGEQERPPVWRLRSAESSVKGWRVA